MQKDKALEIKHFHLSDRNFYILGNNTLGDFQFVLLNTSFIKAGRENLLKYATILNQGNQPSLNPIAILAAFPKLPDLDSLHGPFDHLSRKLVCQKTVFPLPSSPPPATD